MFALVALCSQPGTPSKLPDRRKSSFAGARGGRGGPTAAWRRGSARGSRGGRGDPPLPTQTDPYTQMACRLQQALASDRCGSATYAPAVRASQSAALLGDARLPQPGKTAAIMWYGSNGRRRGVAKHGSSGSIPDICRPGAQAREISAMLELATLASLGYKCGAIRAQLFRRNPGATPFRRSSPPRRRYTLEPLSASLVLPISAATIATCHNYFQNFPPSARADAVHECVPFPRRLEVLGTLTQPGIKRDKNDGCLYDGGATACATTDRMLFPLTYLVHPAQDGGKDCRRLLARLRERQAASRMNWLIKDPNMHHGRGKQLLSAETAIDRVCAQPQLRLVQEYNDLPLLVRGRKFHWRTYDLVVWDRRHDRYVVLHNPGNLILAFTQYKHNDTSAANVLTNTGQQQGLPGFSYDELFMLPEELFSYAVPASLGQDAAHAAHRRRSPPAPPSAGTSTRARAFRASTRRSRRGCSARPPRRTGGCGRGSRRRRRGRRRRCRRWRTARSSRCGRPTGSSRPTSISS